MTTWNVSSSAELLSALGKAAGGDTIFLQSGNYGAVDLSNNFSDYVTIKAASPLGAVFTDLDITGGSYIAIDGLKVLNEIGAYDGANHLKYINSSFADGVRYTPGVSDIVLDHSDITGESVFVDSVANFTITNNVIHDGTSDLLRVTGNSYNGLIENNTMRDVSPVAGDHPDMI